jgi:hypothetical protein
MRACFHPDQNLLPTTQKALSKYLKPWPAMLSLRYRELVAKREIFRQEAPTCAEVAKNRAEQ